MNENIINYNYFVESQSLHNYTSDGHCLFITENSNNWSLAHTHIDMLNINQLLLHITWNNEFNIINRSCSEHSKLDYLRRCEPFQQFLWHLLTCPRHGYKHETTTTTYYYSVLRTLWKLIHDHILMKGTLLLPWTRL